MAHSFRELTENCGVHPDALADATGCHRVTVYAWLSGRKRPRGHRFLAIAEFLGVTPDAVRAAINETERRSASGERT